MAKVDIPQLMIRWRQKDFTSADLQACLEETKALTQELSDPEKMAPERLRQLADGLFRAMRGGFKERLTTLFAYDLRAVQFRPRVSEESSELEEKKEPWDSDNFVGLNNYQIKNKGGTIDVIQALARTLKSFEDRDRDARKFLGECRGGFNFALRQAQLERGLRAPWRMSYLDLLPEGITDLNVAFYPPSKWLTIPGAMSPSYRNAVVRELNRWSLEDSTVERLGIRDGGTLLEFIKSYREGLLRLNLSKCDFVRDLHLLLLAQCPNLRELELTECRKITDKGVQALASKESLVTLLLKYPGTFKGFNPRGLVNLQRLLFGGLSSSEPKITDADFGILATLINLKELYLLDCTKITNDGFSHLTELVNLHELEVVNADTIDDISMAHLATLVRLRKLALPLTYVQERGKITDKGLVYLKKLIELEILDLTGREVTGAGFAHLKDLSQLKKLILTYCTEITDEGMAGIGELASLEHLDLSMGEDNDYQDRLTQQGYAQLTKLPRLRHLNLTARNTSVEALQSVGKLWNLQVLKLGNDLVTHEGLQHLEGLINLQELYIVGEEMMNECLQSVGKLGNLRVLELENVTDEGWQHLAGLVNLEELRVGWKVTGVGAQHLARLANLKKLTVGDGITDEGLQHLGRLENLEELSITSDQMTDEGLRHLVGLRQLRKLKMIGSLITPQGVAWLQRQLPNLDIDFSEWLEAYVVPLD